MFGAINLSQMSYESYTTSFSGQDLPPSSRYNPFDFKSSTRKVDQHRFEYYMDLPKITVPETIRLEYKRHIIDSTAASNGFFVFEKFSSDDAVGFWDEWISDELDKENLADCDGSWTFANHLSWIRFRNALPGIKREQMYIAYITTDKARRHTDSIVIAVCVFVQPGGVYNVSGITKSEKYMHDPAFRGVGMKIQKYIAHIVKTKIDPETKGLLFRPNGLMRNIMIGKIPRAIEGNQAPKLGLMGCFVGSNWDMWWLENVQQPRGIYGSAIDRIPSIIQTYSSISFRIFDIDEEYREYFDTGNMTHIPVPFWEPPSPYPNPDSPNNPQLPLMFVPIDTLLALNNV
jgi:hypothetical protein